MTGSSRLETTCRHSTHKEVPQFLINVSKSEAHVLCCGTICVKYRLYPQKYDIIRYLSSTQMTNIEVQGESNRNIPRQTNKQTAQYYYADRCVCVHVCMFVCVCVCAYQPVNEEIVEYQTQHRGHRGGDGQITFKVVL